MKIVRKSPFTGKINTMDIPATDAQVREWHRGDRPIQDIFPELSWEQREFIKTGITPEEWDTMFPPEDEEL